MSRISIIAFLVVVLGVSVPVMVMSIINGFHENIQSKILDKDFHLQVYQRDDMLEDYLKVCNDLKKIKGIKDAFPFHDGRAIIRYEGEKTGVVIRGYTNRMYHADKSFRRNFKIIRGKWDFTKANRIILGARLAESLGVVPGDIVEVYVDREENTTGFDFSIKRFKVSALFRSGYADFDKNLVFTSLSDAQKLYNYSSDFFGIKGYRAWGIGVKLDNIKDYLNIEKLIVDKFPQLKVRNYVQLNGNLLYAFQWEKKLMMVVLIIMVIATVLTVMLILTVVVMDKKKEIAILKSFGVSHSSIKRIFIAEAFLISFFGTLTGLILGVLLTVNVREIAVFIEKSVNLFIDLVKGNFIGDFLGIYKTTAKWEIVSKTSAYSRMFPYRIYFSDLFILSCMTIFWSLIGGLLPARKATRITVIEAIHNE
jgi:lipoprotein-releasing system permease protein